MIRSNCLKEQFSFYALSKLEFSEQKLSKHYWYFKYLLILSGDINLHLVLYSTHAPCVLNRSEKDLSRVKNVVCEFTKKCNQFEKPGIGSLLICRPCQDKPNDHFDNSWHQFPFADDFFENRGVPSNQQTNIEFGTPN